MRVQALDVADRSRGAVGEDGGAPSVFEFQDSEGDLQAAFEKNLPFAIDVARSADDPADPESHLGNTVADFEPKTFAVSYGVPQPVATLVKRKLGPVTVRWSINGGEEQSAPTQEFQGGERFGGGGAHFHEVRGVVTGAKPGDTVRVRFLAGGRTSSSFRYDQAADSDAPVLLLAAENQKGTSAYPALPAGGALAFDQPYAEALTATGVAFDTWDVDARGGAPDALGVLGHYKAVVWYTGNDLLTRSPGQPGGTGTAKFGNDVTLAVRSFMNEGGKLLYTGQNAAFAATSGVYGYNPHAPPPGDGGVNTPGGGGGAGTPPRSTLPKPPTGRPRSPVPAFTLGAFRVNRASSVPVTVRCRVAASAAGCTVTVSLRSGRSVLGSTRYTLRAGQRRAIIVRVRRATLRTLLRRGRLRVDVRVSNTSGRARSTVITVRRATLEAPARTR